MKKEQLDKIDWELLALLYEDGRKSLTDLGKKLESVKGSSLSHVSVQKRLQKLRKKITKIQANLNFNTMGYLSSYIFVETKDYETERRIIEKTRLCPRVFVVDRLSGKYNLLLQLSGPSTSDINCFTSNVIKSDDLIRSYKIFNSTSNVKPVFLPVPILSSNKRKLDRAPCGTNCLFCGMYKDGTCSGCPATKFHGKKYCEFLQ
jgi:DNA-binding Lrp family transcriptional regulator